MAFSMYGPSFFRRLYNNEKRLWEWPQTWEFPQDAFVDDMDIIYIHIAKTGGVSLQYQLDVKYTFGHMYARYVPIHLRPKIRAIVRNPYDRCVSAYFFMKTGGFGTPRYYQIVKDYPTFESWILNGIHEKDLYWSMQGNPMMPFCLQTEWLVDKNNGDLIVTPDQIGRFENLHNDVKRLFDIEMKYHHNKSEHNPWPTYYANPLVREKVARLYKRDFDLLGYSTQIE